MPFPTINIESFKGRLRLSSDLFELNTLNDYIQEHYAEYARMFLGDKVYREIRDATTNRDKWDDLLNGSSYFDKDQDKNLYQPGLMGVLKSLIYFEYVRDYWLHSTTGMVRNRNENSMPISAEGINSVARTVYNKAMSQYNYTIVCFIDYYRCVVEDITGTTDNMDGTWTIETDCTKYLINGDTVTIEDVDYVVSSVIENTSFVITAPADFQGTEFLYKPFEAVAGKIQHYVTV